MLEEEVVVDAVAHVKEMVQEEEQAIVEHQDSQKRKNKIINAKVCKENDTKKSSS